MSSTLNQNEWKQETQQKIKDSLQIMQERFSSVQGDEEYRKLLKTLSAFHRYSPGNAMLISAQAPNATYVAGFSTWKKLKRTVKKGEKGIIIISPVAGGKHILEMKDSEGNPILDEDGKPITKEVYENSPTSHFRIGYVFDYSQTVGEPVYALNKNFVPAIQENEELFRKVWDSLVAQSPYPVIVQNIQGWTDAFVNPGSKEIRIDPRLSYEKRILTLIHELAHAKIHIGAKDIPRQMAEVEAESVAFILADQLGLDANPSIAYIKNWSENPKVFKASLDRIQKAANSILSGIEQVFSRERIQDLSVEPLSPTTELNKEDFTEDQWNEIEIGINAELDVTQYADPKFNWEQMLEIRLGLQTGLDVSLYADPKFDMDQMYQIRKGLESGVDVSIYADPKFDRDQMIDIRERLEKGESVEMPSKTAELSKEDFSEKQWDQIELGINAELDVTQYADPKFDWEQMSEIRLGLEAGVDVTQYADPKFNWHQMSEIREGIESGVDVSIYADPKFNWYQMSEIREGLESGVDVRIYADPEFGDAEMFQIREGLESGLDARIYADPKFDRNKMRELRNGLKSGVDVSIYADPKFDVYQMSEIREGLEAGVDVSIYTNSDLNQYQMHEIRLGLESGVDVSIYADPKFNPQQMYQIRKGLESGVDASIYADPKFDRDQMIDIRERLESGEVIEQQPLSPTAELSKEDFSEEQWDQIELGINAELDVTQYADPKFDWEQMQQIRKGLESKVDVTQYADPKFDMDQMFQIRWGLESGVDVSIYADPKFDWVQMSQIREGLKSGLDVSIYADPKFNPQQMYQILEGLESKVDVIQYADPKFDWRLMSQIRHGLESGVDASIYADPKFNWEQMREIREGLEAGLDVSIYTNSNLNQYQMSEIREGLEAGVDASIYADPKFDWEQMKQMRLGLKSGLDVSIYADPKFDREQMSEIREGLDSGVDVSQYADPKFDWVQMHEIKMDLIKQERQRISNASNFYQVFDCVGKEELLQKLQTDTPVTRVFKQFLAYAQRDLKKTLKLNSIKRAVERLTGLGGVLGKQECGLAFVDKQKRLTNLEWNVHTEDDDQIKAALRNAIQAKADSVFVVTRNECCQSNQDDLRQKIQAVYPIVEWFEADVNQQTIHAQSAEKDWILERMVVDKTELEQRTKALLKESQIMPDILPVLKTPEAVDFYKDHALQEIKGLHVRRKEGEIKGLLKAGFQLQEKPVVGILFHGSSGHITQGKLIPYTDKLSSQDLVKEVLAHDEKGCILFTNHPNESSTPSRKEKELFTKTLEGLEAFDVTLSAAYTIGVDRVEEIQCTEPKRNVDLEL